MKGSRQESFQNDVFAGFYGNKMTRWTFFVTVKEFKISNPFKRNKTARETKSSN